jgi:hypothetical protein
MTFFGTDKLKNVNLISAARPVSPKAQPNTPPYVLSPSLSAAELDEARESDRQKRAMANILLLLALVLALVTALGAIAWVLLYFVGPPVV